MNLIKKLLSTLSLVAFAVILNAQNVKPNFKELTLVAYIPNDSAKNLAVTIHAYYHIQSDGIIHIIINNMKGLNYNGFVGDTTYKLTDGMINTLNKPFVNGRNLSSYMVKAKPVNGTSLLLPAIFMSYVAANGEPEKVVFLIDFFGRDITNMLNRILFLRRAHLERNIGIFHDNTLEAEILKEHLSCKCIPIEAPPTVKELMIKKN